MQQPRAEPLLRDCYTLPRRRGALVMPTSFKSDTIRLPPQYRTPSPPSYAFEPLSPTITRNVPTEGEEVQWSENRNGLKRPYFPQQQASLVSRETGRQSHAAMDNFVSIMLANKSAAPYQPDSFTETQNTSDHYDSDRASKRSRSEKMSSPDLPRKIFRADTRPATSYEHPPENRRLEAELLLNFAQEAAKFTTPSPVVHQARTFHEQAVSESLPAVASESPTHDTADERIQNTESKSSNNQDYFEYGDLSRMSPGVGSEPPACQVGSTTPNPPALARDHLFDDPCKPSCLPQIGSFDLPTSVFHLQGDSVPARDTEQKKKSSSDVPQELLHSTLKTPGHYPQPVTVMPECDKGPADNIEGARTATHTQVEIEQIGDKLLHISNDALRVGGSGIPCQNDTNNSVSGELQDTTAKVSITTESLTINGLWGDKPNIPEGSLTRNTEDNAQDMSEASILSAPNGKADLMESSVNSTVATAICAACKFSRNFTSIENDNDSTSWISCDGCKSWFHFACAGFKSEREVRSVDIFRCRTCKPIYGNTTYVRKSSRAHSAIDYAGLHEGVIKTSDERPEHHYIKPIKEGTITFLPENFARMRPELVTAEFFEKGVGMKEPVVIPAYFNPQPGDPPVSDATGQDHAVPICCINKLENHEAVAACDPNDLQSHAALDQGQDALDMVIPQGLTVRQVAELYGPEEKVEVIDVKSQNGENKKWNMRRWVDYYENPNNKVVRNVISLEVSQSKLGRLIKRPQVVRDLDLQDSVWPGDLLAKGEYPRVQLYCLMSVADCFTDFHIDFGGSSVFYHILKGKKTFLFIPPKEKHLKKYEDWCMSPAQNWTFLGDQTRECYRVDLSEGDTMLIPAGWIHAVWTPEDSLVIGGNFLTRLNFGMQLRVAQVEKATGVARKFRYPHFQKLHWYTALRYLEIDPLPDKVKSLLHSGESFRRDTPAHYDFDAWGQNSHPGSEYYHQRYYSQPELEGLPDLTRYLLRTALIDIGAITDGISVETRNAVKKSIPRGHGEPLDVIKNFAAWCAWKRGNEPIPHWAYPEAVPENLAPDRLSAAATKRLDQEAAIQAPRRQSARMQSQPENTRTPLAPSDVEGGFIASAIPEPHDVSKTSTHLTNLGQANIALLAPPKRTNIGSHRKTACESCRRRRRACKHKNQAELSTPSISSPSCGSCPSDLLGETKEPASFPSTDELAGSKSYVMTAVRGLPSDLRRASDEDAGHHEDQPLSHCLPKEAQRTPPKGEQQIHTDLISRLDPVSGSAISARPRHKACNDCRKSKVGKRSLSTPIAC